MNYKNKKNLVKALNKINPVKPYGTELFNALLRLTVNIAIETVALRYIKKSDKLEILMTKRSKNDLFFPKQWHSPGTILRPKEKFKHAFNRLSKNEFLSRFKQKPKFIGIIDYNDSPRGREIALVYLIKLSIKTKKGKWFPVNMLPENIIKQHKEKLIPLAISKYKLLFLTNQDKI